MDAPAPDPLAIAEVRAWACRFPLPAPFRLGRATLTARDYVVVRIETAGGLRGAAFSLSRGAPLDVLVCELAAPPVLGRDAGGPAALHAAWRSALPHHAPEGLALRAQSLVEIAAWDVAGQAAGAPVWRLLGGVRDSAPAMLVEGYELAGEDDEAFAQRIRAAAAEGFSLVKLANLPDAPERMTHRMERIRELCGERLGLTVDVGFAWEDHDAAVRLAGRWRELGLTWIEDPLHGREAARLARLREAIDVPLAVGDEVTSRATADELLRLGAVDVLRADATCVGGLGALLELQRRAHAARVACSTHIYPELHRHVALAHPHGGPVELFRPDTPFETPQAFSRPPATVLDPATGIRVIPAPIAPGLGLEIDWESVDYHAVRTHVARLGDAT